MAPIRYDTGITVLAYCTECPGFRVHATDRGEAYRLARAHALAAHPGDKKMLGNVTLNLRREASRA